MKSDLDSLTPDSTLLVFLRAMFSTEAEYGVYIPETGDSVIIGKGQLISMIERNCADAMIKRLPQLAERNIFRPVGLSEIETEELEDSVALFVRNTGSFVKSLDFALTPDAPQFPEWWNAPVPFVMSSRGVLTLNDKAVSMFGTGLQKLNASELPDRDEFIVRLDGLNGTMFIAFRNLSPGIFTIDDCTEDLTDAQDITWWASVGRTWIKEIEARGGTWRRLQNPPEENSKSKKNFRKCEWNGEIQGWLNIEMPVKKAAAKIEPKIKKENNNKNKENNKNKNQNTNQESQKSSHEDDVIDRIGPQAMALLASGQPREGTSFLI